MAEGKGSLCPYACSPDLCKCTRYVADRCQRSMRAAGDSAALQIEQSGGE